MVFVGFGSRVTFGTDPDPGKWYGYGGSGNWQDPSSPPLDPSGDCWWSLETPSLSSASWPAPPCRRSQSARAPLPAPPPGSGTVPWTGQRWRWPGWSRQSYRRAGPTGPAPPRLGGGPPCSGQRAWWWSWRGSSCPPLSKVVSGCRFCAGFVTPWQTGGSGIWKMMGKIAC